MVDFGICMSNSSSRKSCISWRYKLGFSSKCSERAFIMIGVTLCGRPFLIGGALVLPYMRRLERILMTVRLLQPAASAIWDVVSSSLLIISWMRLSVDWAKLGAILHWATSCRLLGIFFALAFEDMIRRWGMEVEHGGGMRIFETGIVHKLRSCFVPIPYITTTGQGWSGITPRVD